MNQKHPYTEVWAQLILSVTDRDRISDFFIWEFGIPRSKIVRRMHLTIYHARRSMLGVEPIDEEAVMVVPANETRFMVMAPGGENPRPNLDPALRKVGIRIHQQSCAMPEILAYRERLLTYETKWVHGFRPPSDHRTNAFGARHFQPHVALLRAGNGIQRDLKPVGERFRQEIGDLRFDRFQVEIVTKERKNVEQDAAGQPATRSESDSERSDKPQPESEGRSR